MPVNQIIQKTTEAIANPKVGMVGSTAGFISYLTDTWQWLGENISIIVGLVSVLVGLVSVWNQIDQIRRRGKSNG